MLGVKFNNRESVHGAMKVVLTPNIGLGSNPKPAQAGLAREIQRGRTLTTE
jgi:hypothetical protein